MADCGCAHGPNHRLPDHAANHGHQGVIHMAIFIALLIFAALMAAISYLGYRFYARPGRLYEQLGGRATFTMPAMDRLTNEEEPGLMVSVLQQIGQMVPTNPDDASVIGRDLMAAGYRSDNAVAVYVG